MHLKIGLIYPDTGNFSAAGFAFPFDYVITKHGKAAALDYRLFTDGAVGVFSYMAGDIAEINKM